MAKTNYDITQDQVLQHLSYNPTSGELRYLTDGHKRKSGDLVPISANVVNILGSSYSKLKLIWFMLHGEWPTKKINTSDYGSGDCSAASLVLGGSAIGKELTQERLREVLDYNQYTGIFSWRISPSSTAAKGAEAGAMEPDGYRKIKIDGRLYTGHRLAFLYMTGAWPSDLVDHKDCNKGNNTWLNLRDANKSQNAQNLRKEQSNNKASGLLGVYRSGRALPWGAKVNLNGRQHHAGLHATPEAAHQAYLLLKQQLHPFSMLPPTQEVV